MNILLLCIALSIFYRSILATTIWQYIHSCYLAVIDVIHAQPSIQSIPDYTILYDLWIGSNWSGPMFSIHAVW